MQVAVRILIAIALSCPSQPSSGIPPTGSCKPEERPIGFHTKQGAISNVDVSPDGKRLAFDLLGDIYVVNSMGGLAQVLSEGASWDVRPIWSPDGTQIAFISDRLGTDHVHTINVGDGSFIPQISSRPVIVPGLLEGVVPAAEWMPGGHAFVISGFQYARDGKALQPISASRGMHGGPYHWNGAKLLHFRPEAPSDPSRTGQFRIWALAERNGEWTDTGQSVISVPSGFEAPAMSTDGRFLVFKDRSNAGHSAESGLQTSTIDSIRVRDLTSGTSRILIGPSTDGWEGDASGTFPHLGRLAISPDSRTLFVAFGGKMHAFDLASGHGSEIPIEIDVSQCLNPIVRHPFPIGGDDVHLKNMRGQTMRPDGTQIAFTVLRKLYTIGIPGGAPQRVDGPVGQFQPAYSPDGRWIAFSTWGPVGGHIWIAPSDGGKAIQLTQTAGYYQTPTWSPDGRSIAFVGHPDISLKRPGFSTIVSGGNIQILSLADGAITILPVLARAGHPLAYTADGQEIRYAQFTDEHSSPLKMSSVHLDGTPRRHEELIASLSDGGIEAALPSPDGHSMALIEGGNLYLMHCADSIGSNKFAADDCSREKISQTGAYDPRWSHDGTYLEWGFANSYFKLGPLTFGTMKANSDAGHGEITTIKIDMHVPRRRAAGAVVLQGARVITMRDAELIEDGAILIEDGRITQVGPSGDVYVPEGATIVLLHGKTILPGFIDAHAHLNDMPRDLLDPNHGEALVYLAFGVTTVKDPSNGGDHSHAYSELIESGEMIGPRMISAEGLVDQRQAIESFQDAKNLAMRTKLLGGTFLKYHTGWSRRGRGWIIEAARETGLNVAAHFPVSNYIPGRLNFTTIVDGATSSEHEFSDNFQATDVANYLAQSGSFINFSPLAGYGRYPGRYWKEVKNDPRVVRFYVSRVPRESVVGQLSFDSGLLPLASPADRNANLISQIAHEGGNVTIGSHGDFDGIGFHWEMWAHARGGMTNHEVLRAATLNGARSLGMEADLGSIEVGKIADLLVLDADPLADIRSTLSVERVMKDGVLRDAMTLDELWPNPSPMPEWRRSEGVSSHVH